MNYPELFTPTKIGKVVLKNKLSMAPMGPVGYADAFGAFNQRLQDYYVERAKGGIGLIITGICSVDIDIEGLSKPGLPCPTQTPLAFIHAAYQMNERIHAYGTKIFVQLTGGLGRSALPGFVSKCIAPSDNGNRFDPKVIHREMTKEEIENLIRKFAMAAAISKKAGFDGIEVHAVHEGYLLDQFAIPIFNKRTDEYGGSLENRLRIATDIVKGIKAACGKDFPVSLRYSLKSCMKGLRQGGLPGEEYEEAGRDIEEGIEAAKILVEAGYDALNVDAGTYDSWYWNHPPMYFEEGMYREFGKILKEHISVPIILAGRMENPELAVEALKTSCDMIGLGRQLLTDPYYPEKIRTGRLDEVRPCLGCHEGCLGRIGNAPVSCAVNPSCGREKIYGLVPAHKIKKFLIIGGGPSGMEAARVLAERGHKVVLCEKNGELGGNLIPGSVPHFKRYDRALINWYQRQLELLNVDVNLKCEITADKISSYQADEVIVATGSTPIELSFGGTGKAILANEVLQGKEKQGKDIAIIGGGLVGCETGLWLAQQGANLTIIEATPEILGGPHGLPHMNRFMLEDLLAFHKVKILKTTKVVSIDEGSVTYENDNGTESIPVDMVISAVGYKENNGLYESLKNSDMIVHNIGDSQKVHNIMYSIWNAYELAREL
ncbi:oxidoreductase [Anaerovorax sp. IOR16]|uniref:oxidoreductase n=1 Tax=Anaerovorax sp. IOR16 TaxID=2773458 RepID=UPI0019CF8F5B|nr:FAD-dependent oxidoreductase [Anaerovorax sp. IOR16]